MSEWKTYKLGEICTDISYGYTESASSEMVGPKFLRITDIQHDFINWNNVPYCPITESNHNKYKLEVGDIVIARTGASTGATAIFKDADIDAVYASYLIRYKIDKSKADPFYIGHLLKSPLWKQHVNSIIGGSGQPGANAKQFASFKIEIPDLPTQKEIAQILTSLDDKIELNLQMNQTLETMAQAIFKEWFVNFNFPGFNGEFVDGLPKGWKYKTIKELGRVITGNTPSSKNPELFGEITPFVTPTDFKNFGKLIIGANRFLSDAGRVAMKTKLLPKNSIIATCIGSDMGKIAINAIECVTNQQINSIIPNDTSLVDYLYYDLVYKYDYLRNIATGGSTMPIINKSRFEEIEILTPNSDLLIAFQSLMDSFNSRIEENIRQSQSLTQTRDTLLPKLMSGQLEVAL